MSITSDTAILIPVRQINELFYDTVRKVRAVVPDTMICVVIDGSGQTIDNARIGIRSIVIIFDENCGKGAALKAGYNRLAEDGYAGVITLDADGQHPPEFIPRFLQVANETNADLVIGNRMADLQGMPWDRRFSNRVSTLLLELLTGRKLHDAQCGYRWLRLSRWNPHDFDCDRFDFEPQLLLQAAWRKWRLAFVPVPALYLHSGSAIERIPDTLRFLQMVGKEIGRKIAGKYR